MQVILHAGAHCTDDGRILKTLFKNRSAFQARGIALPRPRHYRQLLSATVKALSKRAVGPDSRMAFLDAILDIDATEVDRLILHSENFFACPKLPSTKAGFILKRGQGLPISHICFLMMRSSFF